MQFTFYTHFNSMACRDGLEATADYAAEHGFSAVEFHNGKAIADYEKRFNLDGKAKVISSDSHYLGDIKDKENFFLLEDEPYSSDYVRKQLFLKLR